MNHHCPNCGRFFAPDADDTYFEKVDGEVRAFCNIDCDNDYVDRNAEPTRTVLCFEGEELELS